MKRCIYCINQQTYNNWTNLNTGDRPNIIIYRMQHTNSCHRVLYHFSKIWLVFFIIYVYIVSNYGLIKVGVQYFLGSETWESHEFIQLD